jgi:cathepsin D
MAFREISTLNEDPFFVTAQAQGSVKSNEFAFKLADKGSELFLGGVDESKFTGSIEFHSMSSSSGFWQIGNAKAMVGGKVVVSGFQTIIDTGTTIMYGSPNQVAAFYAEVAGSKVFDPSDGLYSFPCDSAPAVSFSWGGKEWPISAAK